MKKLLLLSLCLVLVGCLKEYKPTEFVQKDFSVHFKDGSFHWYRYASGEEKIFVWRGNEGIPSEVYDCNTGEKIR